MRIPLVLSVLALALVSGCGGSSGSNRQSSTGAHVPAATRPKATSGAGTTTSTTGSGPGALQAEANAAAAGDIPDNQIFLTFTDNAAGFTLKVPEGWAQRGAARAVTFRDKNNVVRVVVSRSSRPTVGFVGAAVQHLAGATVATQPTAVTLAAGSGYKLTYSTESAPNAVTGKRVKLVVDRYYLWKHGRLAVVDLGTPVGVDNVDAYRLMIESLRWT